jgi:tRNA G10  N-methylase Trm11
MQEFLFLLGNTPALSLAELNAVYPELKLELLQPQVAIGTSDSFEPQAAIERLGGTVKILKPVERSALLTTEAAQSKLTDLLRAHPNAIGKLQFGIGEIGRDHLHPIEEAEIKAVLQHEGLSVRYVSDTRSGLSAAILTHKRAMIEFLVINTETETLIAETVAVQDVDNWTNRDRNKPYADSKKGMLPPKVARIMVNLALSTTDPATTTLCDPFCGSGTVLLEASVLGCTVIGSDADSVAVDGTSRNLLWLNREYNLTKEYTLRNADVSKLQLPANSITHLVTEPFLGKPSPREHQLPGIFKGLEKLYRGAFKHWKNFLQDGATVVIVMPLVTEFKHPFSLRPFIDDLESLGYTTCSEPIIYARPGATVQRELYQLKYTKQTN